MADIKPGIYKGRAVAGSAQYGLAESNNAQVAIDVLIPSLDGFKVTIPLSFAPKAMRFSVERLRLCGWTGKNIRELDGIDKQDVDVELFYETYNGRQRLKAEIRTTSGTFELSNPMSEKDQGFFAEDVLKAIEADEREAAKLAKKASR